MGVLEVDTIKQERKEKVKKEYLGRTRKLLETKQYSKNLIKGINTWAVLLLRYPGPFLKRTREELKQMGQRTRKLMPMYKVFHPRDDVDAYQERREEADLSALKTALTHRYNDTRTTLKKAEKD